MPKSIRNPQSAIRHPFTAVLLAGGRSTRMGRDKAALEIEGQPLWQRQLATLRATGARDLLISGRADGPFAKAGVLVIEDLTPGAGPLGALEAVLPRMATSHALVLAIDLPAMRADFLRVLVKTALAQDCSVIPESGGRFEPLAAVYAAGILPLVVECMGGPDLSMQNLLRLAMKRQLAIPHPLSAKERALFRNVNSPGDLD